MGRIEPGEPPAALVFHPPTRGSSGSSAFADAVRCVLDAEPRQAEVRLVSPYLGKRVLLPIIEHRRFRLVTDLDECLAAARATDGLVSWLKKQTSAVRHLELVHAKAVLTDGAALIGSANLTTEGFCDRFEIACLIHERSLLEVLASWFEEMWRRAEPIDTQRIEAAAVQARRLARDRPATISPRSADGSRGAHGTLGWMRAPSPARHTDPAGVPRRNVDQHQPAEDGDDLETRSLLVSHLRKLFRSQAEAERVLELLGKALDVAALPAEDQRLHVGFGAAPLFVTIGQRYVIWCSPEHGGIIIGLLLDDGDLAQRAASILPGASIGHFSKKKTPDVPTLHIPLVQLPAVPPEVFESWHRGIRTEVERRTRHGQVPTSSYLRNKRPFLCRAYREEQLRREILHEAFPSFWWFGVNNSSVNSGSRHGHMALDAIRPLLDGTQATLVWPIGNSKPKALYREMAPGDRLLLWTGHNPQGDPSWGIIGTASLISVAEDHVILGEARSFARPITPYPLGQPQETGEVLFLRNTLGERFTPLGDVMRAVYKTMRVQPVTVARVTQDAFRAVLERGGEGG